MSSWATALSLDQQNRETGMHAGRMAIDPVLFGQFLITNADVPVPRPVFRKARFLGFTLLFHKALQLHRVRFGDERYEGALLGNAIHAGTLLEADSEIHIEGGFDPLEPRSTLAEFSGRLILLIGASDGGSCMLYPDAFGTLPIVYSRQRCQAASTATLHSASVRNFCDEEIARSDRLRLTEFDFSTEFHPVHSMREDDCRRLLPNHVLDLHSFTASRYWPKHESSPSDTSDSELARHAAQVVRRNLRALSAAAPVFCGLTAGRDSRVMVAALRSAGARELLCYTFDYGKGTRQNCVDLHVARRLAHEHQLEWRKCAVYEPGETIRRVYKFNTGCCVSTNKARDFFSAASQFAYHGAWPAGYGGEVAVAYFWNERDVRGSYTAEELLRRHGLPARESYLAGVNRWLAELPEGLSNSTIIELFYIENRLACWASAHTYGTAPFKFHVLPFSDMRYIDACLAMGLEFRKSRQSQIEMIRSLDDDLFAIPFERFSQPLNFLWRLRRSRYGWPLRMVPYAVQPLWH